MVGERWQLKRIGTNQLKNLPKDAKIPLIKNKLYTIGRFRDNTIILKSRVVSRKHGCIQKKPESLSIIDYGSANGIFVNKRLIQKWGFPLELKPGDEIGFGVCDLDDCNSFLFRVEHLPSTTIASSCDLPQDPGVVQESDNIAQSLNEPSIASISHDASKELKISDAVSAGSAL